MEKNVGELDRSLRIIFGAALVPFLIFTKGFGKLLGILGVALLATGKTQKCSMYRMMGTSTYETDKG